MSDLMLFGVLKMPYEMAMSTEFNRYQYWVRGIEAVEKIKHLQAALEQIKNNPNCRHEVEAQLGEEIWKPLEGN